MVRARGVPVVEVYSPPGELPVLLGEGAPVAEQVGEAVRQRRLRQVRATGGTGEDRSGPGGLIPGNGELGKLRAAALPGEREREIR